MAAVAAAAAAWVVEAEAVPMTQTWLALRLVREAMHVLPALPSLARKIQLLLLARAHRARRARRSRGVEQLAHHSFLRRTCTSVLLT